MTDRPIIQVRYYCDALLRWRVMPLYADTHRRVLLAQLASDCRS